jgi:chemotaxis protein MotB
MATRHIHIEEDHECEHGGSWKIALADLMTVLMVFFLVMWLSAIMDPGDRRSFSDSFKTEKKPVSAGAQEASPMPNMSGDVLIQPIEELKPLTREIIEPIVKSLNASIEETPEAFSIIIRSDKTFESGRASLNEEARAKLELLAERLLAGRRQMITITGHTDNVPIRNVTFPSNWELSAGRASSVARLFVDFDIPSKYIVVAGRADAEPVSDNDSNLGRSQNRRVVIKIDKKEMTDEKKVEKPAEKPKATPASKLREKAGAQ